MNYSPSRMAAAAIALMTATTLAACSSGDDDGTAPATDVPVDVTASGVAPEEVQFRRVALAAMDADQAAQMVDDTVDIATLLAELNLEDSPSATEAVEWFSAGDCDATPVSTPEIATACSADGTEMFLMGPVAVDGTRVVEADYVENDDYGEAVNLTFDEAGTQALAALTEVATAGDGHPGQIAIIVEGEVISAPTVHSVIVDGQVSIVSGSDSEVLHAVAAALG